MCSSVDVIATTYLHNWTYLYKGSGFKIETWVPVLKFKGISKGMKIYRETEVWIRAYRGIKEEGEADEEEIKEGEVEGW